MTSNIAYLTPMTPEVQKAIAACAVPGQDVHFAGSNDRDEHEVLVQDADYIVSAGSIVDAALLERAKKLRFIQKWGIGVDKIDLAYCREHGIPVAITAGGSSRPVAEHALALMLAVYRRLPMADRQVRQGIWKPAALRTICRQISGRTIGLLGFGSIARLLAHRLRGFDADILYYDLMRADAVTEAGFGVSYVTFNELLARSDILSVHVPLTNSSRKLINAETIARMKDGAVIVNTARGEIIDEDALYAALRSGKLGGAGIDTPMQEPMPTDHPLLTLDQVVVTPHSAGSVFDNIPNIASHVFENIARFERGEPLPPADIVVPPRTSSPVA
jgi:D-3-phosphoglycerate dehydrogenase